MKITVINNPDGFASLRAGNDFARFIGCLPILALLFLGLVLSPDSSLCELGPGRWVHIERQAPQYTIECMFAGPEGTLWVGAGSRFHAFSGDQWSMYEYETGELTNHSPFLIDSAGRLYFIDSDDLVVWDDGSLRRFTGERISTPVNGVVASDGNVYIGSYNASNGGIFMFDGESVSRLSGNRTRSVTIDSEGALWATYVDPDTGGMKLAEYSGGAWIDKTDRIDFLFPVTTNELTVQTGPGGALWVSNLGKYGVFENGEWSFFNGGGAVVFIRFDATGKAWGYGYKKVYKLDSAGRWIEVFSMVTGTTTRASFFAALSDGSVWSFDGSEIYRYDGAAFRVYRTPNDLASDIVTCIDYHGNGDLVCGHGVRGLSAAERRSEGISIRNGETWINGKKFDDVEFTDVYDVKRMPDDDVMTYTDYGFKMLTRHGWELLDSLNVHNQTDMVWDDEIMWISTTRGLVEYVEGPEFEFYFPLDGDIVYTLDNLSLFNNDTLYMQSPKGDIFTYDGSIWYTLVDDDGFTNDFAVDEEGTVWGARQRAFARWDDVDYQWITIVDLDVGRACEIDLEGRIWVSGYGTTGYYEEGVFYEIQELEGYAADVFAFSDDGRIAVNAFDEERETFHGLFEFRPSTEVAQKDDVPAPFVTAVNHPNPFNSSTTITFDIPSASFVTVEVFSVTGQRIATLAEKHFPAGKHGVVWDIQREGGGTAASGVYFYRVRAGSAVATGKMLFVK